MPLMLCSLLSVIATAEQCHDGILPASISSHDLPQVRKGRGCDGQLYFSVGIFRPVMS